jgi:spartin
VVGHRFGPEAGEISKSLGGGFKNVGLVYIDAAGVSRKAIVKSVAKGMVVGKVKGGGDLIVGGGDGGVITSAPSKVTGATANWKEKEALEGRYTDDASVMSGGRDSPDVVGYGRAAPPSYSAGVGESLDGQRAGDSKRG